MIKTFFFLSLFICGIFAQNYTIPLNENVEGVLQSAEGIVFIVGGQYYQLSSNDFYEDYYRKIYNDSTIVNPNTELKSDMDLFLLPYFNVSDFGGRRFIFSESIEFGLFLQIDRNGGYQLSQYGTEIIDSLFSE